MSRDLDRIRRFPVPLDVTDLNPSRMPDSPPAGFVSFRYSYTEIAPRGREVHVRMKRSRFEDGKLTSEECEGTLDRDHYRQALQDKQEELLGQAFGLARALLAPFFGRRDR